MPWSPYNATTSGSVSPYAWWRADYGVYVDAGSTLATNGQTCQQWNDIVSAKTLSQATSGARPTLNTSYINGKPALTFDGGDSLVVATTNDWTFLHNGSGATTFIVWKVTADAGDQACVLLDNNNTTSGNIGYSLFYDNRSSVPATQRLTHTIAKGTLSIWSWSLISDGGSWRSPAFDHYSRGNSRACDI